MLLVFGLPVCLPLLCMAGFRLFDVISNVSLLIKLVSR